MQLFITFSIFLGACGVQLHFYQHIPSTAQAIRMTPLGLGWVGDGLMSLAELDKASEGWV